MKLLDVSGDGTTTTAKSRHQRRFQLRCDWTRGPSFSIHCGGNTRLVWAACLLIAGWFSVFMTLPCQVVLANEPVAADFNRFFSAHCLDCHQGDDSSAGIDIATLLTTTAEEIEASMGDRSSKPASADDTVETYASEDAVKRWIRIYDQIRIGEMPPDDAQQPSQEERASIERSLFEWLQTSESKRAHVTLRRLNRREYENTVHDLFDISLSVMQKLPADATVNGFDTVGDGLELSTEAMLAYLDASDVVLNAVFGPAVAPKTIEHRTNFLEQTTFQGGLALEQHFGKMFRKTRDGIAIFQSNYCPTNLLNFARLRAPAGSYRGSVRVRAIQSKKPVTMRIYGGDTISSRREKHLVGYYDIEPGDWTTVTFTDRLVEDGGTYAIKCYNTADIRKGADTYTGPGLEIGDITIEGPLDPWPPTSRSRLLGDVDIRSARPEDARKIFGRLLPNALRRDVQPSDIDFYVQIVNSAMSDGADFETALRTGLKVLLCSPEFLFLNSPERGPAIAQANSLDDFELATRLSYFLWSSTPDEELLSSARSGQLHVPATLQEQVDRMLNDARSDRFVHGFTDQWLQLHEIDFTEPDPELFPEYDELLRLSMVEETRRFFRELLGKNLPVRNFIDSDFTYLNSRLATHYQIDGVKGLDFQRVQIPKGNFRGGVMTQASVLKVTANGTNTSAVIRGNWVLERIFGDPSLPPPANVPAIEPDIRGATSPRQQLELHRKQPQCASCHNKFDPLGFALENFDPIGGWREQYRTKSASGRRPTERRAPFTHAFIKYRFGLPVDSRGVTEDGAKFRDIREFKKYVLSQESRVRRSIIEKLLTYATGRTMRFSDRTAIETIAERVDSSDAGLRSIIHEIVQSSIFQGR